MSKTLVPGGNKTQTKRVVSLSTSASFDQKPSCAWRGVKYAFRKNTYRDPSRGQSYRHFFGARRPKGLFFSRCSDEQERIVFLFYARTHSHTPAHQKKLRRRCIFENLGKICFSSETQKIIWIYKFKKSAQSEARVNQHQETRLKCTES